MTTATKAKAVRRPGAKARPRTLGGAAAAAAMDPGPSSVERWMAEQMAADAQLREAVETRLAAMRITQDLAALRERRGLSQAQLARVLGVSQPAVAKLEAGRSGNVGLKTLIRVATVLGAVLAITLIASADD